MNRIRGHRDLIELFRGSVARHGARPALWVDGRTLTYDELWHEAGSLAHRLVAAEGATPSRVGVFAQRTVTAYAGVLATLAAGKTYVPLNRRFPASRTSAVVERAGCTTLIADSGAAGPLAELLGLTSRRQTILLEGEQVEQAEQVRADLSARFPQHVFAPPAAAADGPGPQSGPANGAADAYVMFTSGSTGTPKGVPVTHANVLAYLDGLSRFIDVGAGDRFSQTFDLTFDLSVHDLFLAWAVGGCLYCLPERYTMTPAKFIRDHRLTAWFSVPSVLMFMDKLGLLEPNSLPDLRTSLFCGEPLPAQLAAKWQAAAPNSIVENLYGPTEATVAISHYRWDSSTSPAECRDGITPIGWMFAGQQAVLIDDEGAVLGPESTGQLCLAGSQVTRGYLNDGSATARQFRELEGSGGTWYLTGDRARVDERGCYHYLGRIDNQVKIRGHRVELQEIEHFIRQAAGTASVACLPWPPGVGLADSIYAFVSAPDAIDRRAILQHCARHLGAHMVPRQILSLDELPLNANGKVDRGRLTEILRETLEPSTGKPE